MGEAQSPAHMYLVLLGILWGIQDSQKNGMYNTQQGEICP